MKSWLKDFEVMAQPKPYYDRLRDYIDRVDREEKQVAWAFINQPTDEKVIRFYHIPAFDLEQIRERLRVEMAAYLAIS